MKPYPSIGKKEEAAVLEVLRSGVLSGFIAGEPDGGPRVIALERAWARRYGVRHAVAFNSATSGLFAAVGAVGVNPGDTVIVPALSMSATATVPLFWGAISQICDVDGTGCLDPSDLVIDDDTGAIISVNLFGARSQRFDGQIPWIEDCAQSPTAGLRGDIAVYSLNYHKHIHCGEGGVAVTNSNDISGKLKAIRNHGENVRNLPGLNLRMTEIEAAIALCQLEDIDIHVGRRVALAEALTDGTKDLWDTPPKGNHDYYVWGVRYKGNRERLSKLLTEEGFPHFCGYRPLYDLPIFHGGYLPMAEAIDAELIGFETCKYDAAPEPLINSMRRAFARLDPSAN